MESWSTGGGHGGLPDLALGHLAIAQDRIDPVVLSVHLTRQGHTHGGGEPLTQRTGGHVNTGDMDHIGMAGEMPLDRAEKLQLFSREVALQGQDGIEGGRTVALGEHEAVPVRIVGVLRVHLHLVKIEHRQNVHHRESPADMAGGRSMDHIHAQQAALGGGDCQFMYLCLFHLIHLSFEAVF